MNFRLCAFVVVALSVFGCARQQCPKMPETACGQCSVHVATETKSAIREGAAIASETADTVLALLIQSEKYLSEKIAIWKRNNPELVAEAQESLNSVRAKITEIKRAQWKALTDSL